MIIRICPDIYIDNFIPLTRKMKYNIYPDDISLSVIVTAYLLLFTPCPVTRFAMHRIYAICINSRGMSRDFGILMPKHLAG